jgi:hypothetical protein
MNQTTQLTHQQAPHLLPTNPTPLNSPTYIEFYPLVQLLLQWPNYLLFRDPFSIEETEEVTEDCLSTTEAEVREDSEVA